MLVTRTRGCYFFNWALGERIRRATGAGFEIKWTGAEFGRFCAKGIPKMKKPVPGWSQLNRCQFSNSW